MERNQENARQVRLQRGAGDPHAGRRPMTARPRGSATRPHAPGPGGHPAPSGRSAGTRLPVGSAGWNRQRRGDFTPPSWDPAARYRQPCTSCLKTQGRERARETRVLAEWREGRRPARREGRGAAGCISAVPLAMVGTRRPPRGRRPATAATGELAPQGPGLPLPAASQPFRFQPLTRFPLPTCT